MSRSPAPWLAIVVLLPLAGACDQDCDNPQRLDGTYRVWSNVVTHTPEPEALDPEYPVEDIFYNGLSEWSLKYFPARAAFDLALGGSQYSASFVQDSSNCNAFELSFGAAEDTVFVTPDGTIHEFQWAGDLVYFGSHIGGTFSYEATWSNALSGAQGHVTATGELTGTKVTDDSDTGAVF